MATTASSGTGRRWWAWLAAALAALAAALSLAWVTGAFTAAAAEPGACFDYQDLSEAGLVESVPCTEPHTAQAVALLAPALDRNSVRARCRSAALDWLEADARRSQVSSAHRTVLVEVQAPWRRSGIRCDVVRASLRGEGPRWTLEVVVGSAQGAMADHPRTWAQCRRLTGSTAGASVRCKSSGRRVVEFRLTVRTKGRFDADKAYRAALEECQAVARGEVRDGAGPVAVGAIRRAAWDSGKTTTGWCAFTTKVWKHAER